MFNILKRLELKLLASGLHEVKYIDRVITSNRLLLEDVFDEANESWLMLRAHAFHGWKTISSNLLLKQRKGFLLLQRFIEKSNRRLVEQVFYALLPDERDIAHLACIEGLYKTPQGALDYEMFGHYTLDDNGRVAHVKSDRFLGRKNLRINHGFLQLHKMVERTKRLNGAILVKQLLTYINKKNFLATVDLIWHRALARKALSRIKDVWINSLDPERDLSGNNANLGRDTNPVLDYENYAENRAQQDKDRLLRSAIIKLSQILNKNPKGFIRENSVKKIRKIDPAQKLSEYRIGFNTLHSVQRNLKHFALHKIETAYHSGLLMHNDYLSKKLMQIKIEYMNKLIQEGTLILEGTFKRRLRNDMNHFYIRLANKNLLLNRILIGGRIIRKLVKKHRILNLNKAWYELKSREKPRKKIDPMLVDQFMDAIDYFFNNRKSEGFGAIQSYVMEFEVLKIEEINNKMQYSQTGVVGLSGIMLAGDGSNTNDRHAAEYHNPYNFSNNSLESKWLAVLERFLEICDFFQKLKSEFF